MQWGHTFSENDQAMSQSRRRLVAQFLPAAEPRYYAFEHAGRGGTPILDRGSAVILACDRGRVSGRGSRLLLDCGSAPVMDCVLTMDSDGRVACNTSGLIFEDKSRFVLDADKTRRPNGDSALVLACDSTLAMASDGWIALNTSGLTLEDKSRLVLDTDKTRVLNGRGRPTLAGDSVVVLNC